VLAVVISRGLSVRETERLVRGLREQAEPNAEAAPQSRTMDPDLERIEAGLRTALATKVTLIHRRDSMRASAIMQDRARANPKIEFVWNAVVEEVLGDGSVAGARLRDVVTGETREISAAGLFVAIGHTPNTRLYEGQLELNEGYIAVREPTTRTSVEGVFAAGDVVDFVYRQAITAAGMGCKAAIDAERFLEAEYH